MAVYRPFLEVRGFELPLYFSLLHLAFGTIFKEFSHVSTRILFLKGRPSYSVPRTWYLEGAVHLDISVSTLNKPRKHFGISSKEHGRGRKQSSLLAQKDEIAVLAAKGRTCREIVRALNLAVWPEQVRRFMHGNGISLLARQGAQPGAPTPAATAPR